jgi:hypothetical protein
MKKLLSTSIIVIVIILSSLFTSAIAAPNISCPPGFVRITKFIMVNINGALCRYRVDLCVQCPAGTHPVPFTVKLSTFTADPINCGFDPSQAKDSIMKIVTDPNWIQANLSTDCFAGWGPCPENAVTVTEVFPICWEKIKYLDDENHIQVLYAGCDEGCGCMRDKIICWNGKSFDSTYVSDYYSQEGCFDECENILEPDNSTIPDPTIEVPFPTSICFGLRGPCNP